MWLAEAPQCEMPMCLPARERAVGRVPGRHDELRRGRWPCPPGRWREVLERRDLRARDGLVVPDDRVAVLQVVHELLHLRPVLGGVERARRIASAGTSADRTRAARSCTSRRCRPATWVRSASVLVPRCRVHGAARGGGGADAEGRERLLGRVVAAGQVRRHDHRSDQADADHDGDDDEDPAWRRSRASSALRIASIFARRSLSCCSCLVGHGASPRSSLSEADRLPARTARWYRRNLRDWRRDA